MIATLLMFAACVHAPRGESHAVDWNSAIRAPERIRPVEARDLDRHVAAAIESWRTALDQPFDSGVPRATARSVRRARMRLEMPILVDDLARRPDRDDVLFLAVRADRWRDLIAAQVPVLTPDGAAALGIRAWPARVVPVGPEEVEIHEGD